MNVVLLSTSKDRVEAIRAACRRKGFPCMVVPDEQHASVTLHELGEGVFIVDAEAGGDLGQLLRNRSPNWPVLILTARFDSSAWVEMFKAGASEVIGDPLNRRKVDAALEGFLRQPPARPRAHTIWRAMASRFGFGADS